MRASSSEERTNYPVTLSVDDMGEGFRLNVQARRRRAAAPGRHAGQRDGVADRRLADAAGSGHAFAGRAACDGRARAGAG
ncbi:hypothetical protein LP420_13380 [Massilia sp. B-10]|nr:hypothetical protein LP420_13380 [Massilia sp. B-10]